MHLFYSSVLLLASVLVTLSSHAVHEAVDEDHSHEEAKVTRVDDRKWRIHSPKDD